MLESCRRCGSRDGYRTAFDRYTAAPAVCAPCRRREYQQLLEDAPKRRRRFLRALMIFIIGSVTLLVVGAVISLAIVDDGGPEPGRKAAQCSDLVSVPWSGGV